jgi:hypothetical protein
MNETVKAMEILGVGFEPPDRVAMVAPVEVGEGGVALLVSNGLLREHQTRDRKAVGRACLAAFEQWSKGRGARTVGQ